MQKIKYVDFSSEYSEIRNEILEVTDRILSQGNYILGDEVAEFEEKFAQYCGTKYAIGVSNGTVSLYMIMKSLNIGAGDEVITVPNTFIATVSAIVHTGANVVFVDVDEDYNINTKKVEEAITARTKAIIPVHLCGRIANMNEINKLAQKFNLHVIEDAAQAVGATYHKQKSGSFGIAASFSLHPLKNLGAYGDAGIITTNDLELYNNLKKFRNHGLIDRDHCDIFGLNARLDTLQAALLLVKLKYLDSWNNMRRERAAIYTKELKNYVNVPIEKIYERNVYHTYVIEINNRDKLQEYLLENGVETKIHYPVCIHKQNSYKRLGYSEKQFINAENQAKKILTLPNHNSITKEQQGYIIKLIKKFMEYN